MMHQDSFKKAIVLGIGNAQVDAIRYLKSKGWFVIGCSYKEEGPGLYLVDQFELIDIIDSAAIEILAVKEEVRFVYSIGSDISLQTIAKVSHSLGLPSFFTTEQAESLQNKVLLRKLLNQNDVSPVNFISLHNLEDLRKWSIFPAIMKPVDSQGQRGVFLVESIEDLYEKFHQSLKYSKSKSIIIEEYLRGPEISANVFVYRGNIVFNLVSDRITVPGFPGGIPQSHQLPSKTCVDLQLDKTTELITKCIEILGIQNGPVYFQIKLTSTGPKIIEITPRLDGCHLWHLIRWFCGIDLLDMTFRLLTEQELELFEFKQRFQSIHLDFSYLKPGERYRDEGVNLPEHMIYHERYYSDGDLVQPVNGYLEKTGYVIIGDA
jgi:predicted ATP-grasp superfamily ATP-dependent carboligase